MSMTLRQSLTLLFDNFHIPTTMLDHGLVLLERIIDIDNSTANRLKFKSNANTNWHVIEPSARCGDMVYLLIKDLDASPEETLMRRNEIQIKPSTRLYGGQTMNLRRRESNRRGHLMADSNIKICLGHNLSHYQMDCLEATLIAFLLLQYGLRTTNRSVYPRFVYRNIPSSLNIDDRNQHPASDTCGIATIGLISRVLIVATAPPMRVLNNEEYQRNVQEWMSQINQGALISNPLVDINGQSQTSPTMRFVRDLIQSPIQPDYGTDQMQLPPAGLPDCINHYPDVESDNYRGISRNVSEDDIIRADRNVRQSIRQLNRDVIIMLGARPTYLFPHHQRHHYFAEVCPFVDLISMTPDRYGFVFWWPEPGLRRYSTKDCRQMLDQLFRLLSHQLHLLLWKIREDRPYLSGPFSETEYGVVEGEGYKMINWLANQAVSLQIFDIYQQISTMWGKTAVIDNSTESISSYDSIIPFEVICKYTTDNTREKIGDPEITLFPERLLADLPAMTIAEVRGTWSASTTSRLFNYCTRRIANYHSLPEVEQARQLQLAA